MAKVKNAIKVIEHPDKEEILNKLIQDVPIDDIAEWLASKYDEVNEKQFILSKNILDQFKTNYLDFYQTLQKDLVKKKNPQLATNQDVLDVLQSNMTYQKALSKYANNEVDVMMVMKKAMSAIEARVEQIFDEIQQDPRNFKFDRTLLEFFNVLLTSCEKFYNMQNGNAAQQQINIQNNINVQVVDQHIAQVYEIVREIISMLDFETSTMFMDKFNQKISALLQSSQQSNVLPVETRLETVKTIQETIQNRLS